LVLCVMCSCLSQVAAATLKLAAAGGFSDPPGLTMYIRDGVDSNGLQLWLCMRGTNITESYHQKILNAFGPTSAGTLLSLFLFESLSLLFLPRLCLGVVLADMIVASHRIRFNVRSGRRFLGLPDFGHYDLGLFDTFFELWMDVYGAPKCTGWLPLSYLPAPQSSAGIGPLCTAEDIKLVPDGLAISDKQFTRAIRHLANQMKVTYPPLPIATPKEKSLFNKLIPKFLKSDSNKLDSGAMQRHWVQHVDCKLVFPKLPSHLSSHFKTWQRARNREATMNACKSDIVHLRNELALAPAMYFPPPLTPKAKPAPLVPGRRSSSLCATKQAAKSSFPASGDHDKNSMSPSIPVLKTSVSLNPPSRAAQSPSSLVQPAPKVPSRSGTRPCSSLSEPSGMRRFPQTSRPGLRAFPSPQPLTWPVNIGPGQVSGFNSSTLFAVPRILPAFQRVNLGRYNLPSSVPLTVRTQKKRGRPRGTKDSGPRKKRTCRQCNSENCARARSGHWDCSNNA
jgi:hypothetical protein